MLSPSRDTSYDSVLRAALSSITNVSLLEDRVWIQATLPIQFGGLGIRRAAQLASSAFLASAAICSTLVSRILPTIPPSLDPAWPLALSEWQKDHDLPLPPPESIHLQKAWDFALVSHTFDSLLDSSPDDTDRARLLASAAKESGAWLSAAPMSSIRLRMEDKVIRVGVGLHLGVPLCEPHNCPFCGSNVDRFGTHGLKCRYSKG